METILNNLTAIQLLHVDYSIKNLPKKLSLCVYVLKWEHWIPTYLLLDHMQLFQKSNWPEGLQNQLCLWTWFELCMCSWMCRTDLRTI